VPDLRTNRRCYNGGKSNKKPGLGQFPLLQPEPCLIRERSISDVKALRAVANSQPGQRLRVRDCSWGAHGSFAGEGWAQPPKRAKGAAVYTGAALI
jgi:hypothetical protein